MNYKTAVECQTHKIFIIKTLKIKRFLQVSRSAWVCSATKRNLILLNNIGLRYRVSTVLSTGIEELQLCTSGRSTPLDSTHTVSFPNLQWVCSHLPVTQISYNSQRQLKPLTFEFSESTVLWFLTFKQRFHQGLTRFHQLNIRRKDLSMQRVSSV